MATRISQEPSYTKAYISGVAFGEKSTPDYTWDGVFVENKKLETKYLPNDLMNQLKELSNEVSSMWDSINSTQSTADNAKTTADNAQTAANKAQTTADNTVSMIKEKLFIKIKQVYQWHSIYGDDEGKDNFNIGTNEVNNYYKISNLVFFCEDIIDYTGFCGVNTTKRIVSGENCFLCGSNNDFIIVYKTGECVIPWGLSNYTFTAPSSGIYARKKKGESTTSGKFTFYQYHPVIINSNTQKKYYLSIDDTGILTTTEITT